MSALCALFSHPRRRRTFHPVKYATQRVKTRETDAKIALGATRPGVSIRGWIYADAVYKDPAATLDDLRESVNTLEDTERKARRVLGGSHPDAVGVGKTLRNTRAALQFRDRA